MSNTLNCPRISVVIPSLNQGKYLEQTLESIYTQNYPEVEILVLDGGSTDETKAILRKHSARISHWTSRKDGGQLDAILSGLSMATGDILCWQNAGDLFAPIAFGTVAQCTSSDESLDFIFGRINLVDDTLRVLRTAYYIPPRIDAFFYGACHIPSQACFWRRTLMTKTLDHWGPLDRTIKFSMEHYLFPMLLSQSTKTLYVPRVLGIFRVHESSKTAMYRMSPLWANEYRRVRHEFIIRGLAREHSGWRALAYWVRFFYWHIRLGQWRQLCFALRNASHRLSFSRNL